MASPPRGIRGPGRFEAALVPVAAAADGALVLPEEPGTGGRWALGAAPDASRGTVLVAGRLDTRESGPGVFAALHQWELGARTVLTGADGRAHTYRITARRSYRQETLPGGLFDSGGAPRPALVTCAGRYDRATGRYEDNLVLYGTPASPPSPSISPSPPQRR
ncbi:class F sortase [Streptomyces enissocaesilis]|uniref:Class F sortase n=1 Tax=Streptomyces enissocaesilis TaxID=332589 RepID=A0ABN3X8U9_9ACTN